MKQDCLFCQIAHGDKDKLVWENEWAAAFNDVRPKAPVHVLVVPKTHVDQLDSLEDEQLAGQLLMAVKEAADVVGVKGSYQVRLHNGRAAGQEIDHLHFHILAEHQ